MNSRTEEAVKLKHNNHNCAQAVACTYADIAGVDREILYKINQAFGGGLGTMEGHCGAISGAATIVSLLGNDKKTTMKDMREISNAFKERNGSVICKDLKGIETGKILRSCDDCVRDAAEFLEKILEDRGNEL